MTVYFCEISGCKLRTVKTIDRKFIFKHYCTHLRQEIIELAANLGIKNSHYENKLTLIRYIIDRRYQK